MLAATMLPELTHINNCSLVRPADLQEPRSFAAYPPRDGSTPCLSRKHCGASPTTSRFRHEPPTLWLVAPQRAQGLNACPTT
jgi:hypothetical protein